MPDRSATLRAIAFWEWIASILPGNRRLVRQLEERRIAAVDANVAAAKRGNELSALRVEHLALEQKLERYTAFLAQANADKSEQSTIIRMLREQLAREQERADRSAAAEREALQMIINTDAQLKYRFVPFPNAPHIPKEAAPADRHVDVESPFVHASDLVSIAARENRAKLKGNPGAS